MSFFIAGGIAARAGPTLVDSFEDGGLSEYSASSIWSVTTNFATDGSNGVECSGTTSAGNIVSTSGLDNYPSKPAEIRCDWETNVGASGITNNMTTSVLWAASGTSDYYMAQVDVDGSSLRIWKSTSAGGLTTIDGGGATLSSSISANTTYTFKIQWDDGNTFGGLNNDITVEILDSTGTSIGSNTANDSDHAASSGIGFRANMEDTTHRASLDYYRYKNEAF